MNEAEDGEGDDESGANASYRTQLFELTRFASQILKWLDEQRGPETGENVRQPLYVALERHFDGCRRELKSAKEGAPEAAKDELNRSAYAQRYLCATIGLACSLDAAQMDPSEARSALEASPLAGQDARALLSPELRTTLMNLVLDAGPHLEKLHELDASAAALQNWHEIAAANSISSRIGAWNQGLADALGELTAITCACQAVATKLKIASSLKPDVRRKLAVPSLVGMSPAAFERAINDLLLRLHLGNVDDEVLARIAYVGVTNPPKDPARSLARRLARIDEQRRAPTKI